MASEKKSLNCSKNLFYNSIWFWIIIFVLIVLLALVYFLFFKTPAVEDIDLSNLPSVDAPSLG